MQGYETFEFDAKTKHWEGLTARISGVKWAGDGSIMCILKGVLPTEAAQLDDKLERKDQSLLADITYHLKWASQNSFIRSW